MIAFLKTNISFDMTLLFQVINTLILLLIIIGVTMLIVKSIRRSKSKTNDIEELNQKMDLVIEKLDKESQE